MSTLCRPRRSPPSLGGVSLHSSPHRVPLDLVKLGTLENSCDFSEDLQSRVELILTSNGGQGHIKNPHKGALLAEAWYGHWSGRRRGARGCIWGCIWGCGWFSSRPRVGER